MALLQIDEPKGRRTERGSLLEHPFLQLGFRPFYLLAALLAALAVPVWTARYFGAWPSFTAINLNWHMHEMVFGFAVAVIIGFLFTAARNWTGLWTPRKGHLLALAALWLAGRIGMLSGVPLLAAALDLLFLPLAAWPLFQVFRRSGNRKNMFMIAILTLLTTFNALYHLAVSGWIAMSPTTAIEAAILAIVVLESVIGARVIPMFTANAVPGTKPVVHARRDVVSVALTALACTVWIADLPAAAIAACALAAACSQLVRLIGWKPHRSLRNPLLWILHLSYGWIPIGFILLALEALGFVTASAAFHALAVGSMAGLILGMMTRTVLGHTGRMLKSGRSEQAMYLLIQAGAVARVYAALDTSGLRDVAIMFAATAWGLAFVLYVVVYGPYLFQPRVDGKEG